MSNIRKFLPKIILAIVCLVLVCWVFKGFANTSTQPTDINPGWINVVTTEDNISLDIKKRSVIVNEIAISGVFRLTIQGVAKISTVTITRSQCSLDSGDVKVVFEDQTVTRKWVKDGDTVLDIFGQTLCKVDAEINRLQTRNI